MISFLLVFISSMILFDKSVHPVVLSYHLICIFVKIHEKQYEGKPRKNNNPNNPGEGVRWLVIR